MHKMAFKCIVILFIELVIEFFVLKCTGRPHGSDNIDNITFIQNEEELKSLLRVFGLDNVKPHQDNSTSPPQYMLDLYKSYSDNPVSEQSFRHHNANTVRSFFDKGESDDHGHYHFQLDGSIPKHEEIVDAEFHLFTDENACPLPPTSHITQIQLYENQEDTSKLLQARMISAHSSGWEVFRVKSSVKKWFSNPELNRGLSVKVLDPHGYEWSDERLKCLQNSRKPILVIFSKDPRIIKIATPRNSQNSNSIELTHTKKNKTKHKLKIASNRNTRSASMHERHPCARHELRVDFDKLGWSSWIISPKWYDAYICTGTCVFPIGQHHRPTNHATVQSIVHELGLVEGIRTPCCVPTELHPVNLLYFDEHSNVVLKQYDDMIAAGCGCQ